MQLCNAPTSLEGGESTRVRVVAYPLLFILFLFLFTLCLLCITQVQLLYQDESLGREIAFQVQRLEMWSRQPQELQPALTAGGSSTSSSSNSKQGIHDIDRYLNRFW